MKAMILAAGLGTRLHPLTDNTPKALVKINNKTLLELAISRLKEFGVEQIIINVHHFADQIISFIKENNFFDIHIEISREEDLLDTGGGLKKAGWFFEDDEPFIMHNVDIISDLNLNQLMKFHKESSALATLATRSRNTNRYLLTDATNTLCGWESIQSNEKKIVRKAKGQLSRVSFMGIHIISPQLLPLLPNDKKFSIINAYLNIAKNHIIKTMPCDAYRWLDLGKPEQLNQAAEQFPEIFS